MMIKLLRAIKELFGPATHYRCGCQSFERIDEAYDVVSGGGVNHKQCKTCHEAKKS